MKDQIFKILLVEDEKCIGDMIQFAFMDTDFILLKADHVKQAKSIIEDELPHLILMDWMLPGKSGLEFSKELKSKKAFQHIPIIMLSAKSDEKNVLKAFEAGVEDYIAKPFSPKQLIARIQAVLKRVYPVESSELVVGSLKLDDDRHEVSFQGKKIKLGPLEYRLLQFFMMNPERVFSRSKLLDKVWGTDKYIEERTVDVHIRRLRKNIAKKCSKELIETVRGAGYRLLIKH